MAFAGFVRHIDWNQLYPFPSLGILVLFRTALDFLVPAERFKKSHSGRLGNVVCFYPDRFQLGDLSIARIRSLELAFVGCWNAAFCYFCAFVRPFRRCGLVPAAEKAASSGKAILRVDGFNYGIMRILFADPV